MKLNCRNILCGKFRLETYYELHDDEVNGEIEIGNIGDKFAS